MTSRFVLRTGLLSVLLLLLWVSPGSFGQDKGPSAGAPAESPALGIWAGDSTCVGDRPACKNEKVVYRFEAVPGRSEQVLLLADKIIDGKRVPMGGLECRYDAGGGLVTCEFTRGRTHGIWQYKLDHERMEGTLYILPERSVGRNVTVHRVLAKDVPEAPPRDAYGLELKP